MLTTGQYADSDPQCWLGIRRQFSLLKPHSNNLGGFFYGTWWDMA